MSLNIPAYASNASLEMEDNSIFVINEFTEAKRLADMPTARLEALGYRNEEIAEIRSYRDVYIDHLKQLNEKNDDTLKAVGYSDEQIEVIRNFTGTDAELTAASATVTIAASGSLAHNCENNHRVEGRLNYYWTWSGIPAFKGKDEIAVSWNGWECVSSTGQVFYYSSSTGQEYGTPGTVEVDEGNLETEGIGHRINMRNGIDPYYAKSGGGTFYVRTDTGAYGLVKDMNYYIAYGHSHLSFSAEISFSITGISSDISISFTPEWATSTMAELKNSWVRCADLDSCSFGS